MYEEYMHAEVDMRLTKQTLQMSITKNKKDIFNKVMKCRRIIILGDGNRFSLLLYQKALTYLDHSCEIPVYLGSEETVIEEYNLTKDDLVIIVSLHENCDNFLMNRSLFYQDAKYLELKTDVHVAFIGIKDTYINDKLYFHYEIPNESFDLRMACLNKFFLDMTHYILLNTDTIN